MKRSIVTISLIIILAASQLSFVAAQTPTRNLASDRTSVDIKSDAFQFVVCDGPVPPTGRVAGVTYCDFNGLILTVQHLIDIAMVIGVLAAIVGFCFMGYLHITGTQENIKRARAIFPKIFFGFILMLAAWFIVYQLLSWLGSNDGFKALIGNP